MTTLVEEGQCRVSNQLEEPVMSAANQELEHIDSREEHRPAGHCKVMRLCPQVELRCSVQQEAMR
jgi:hypothetical protein